MIFFSAKIWGKTFHYLSDFGKLGKLINFQNPLLCRKEHETDFLGKIVLRFGNMYIYKDLAQFIY